MPGQMNQSKKHHASGSYQVVIIGSGFGGQCAAMQLIKKGISDFLILERRSFAGGTWCQNTYPGAAVDVQSPLYSIASEPYDWSRLFAGQDELKAYTLHILEKYGLHEKIRLNTYVNGMTWDEADKCWEIGTTDNLTFRAQLVVNATGPLSKPIIPAFKGRDRFDGKSFHTNEWDHSYDHRGKRVAVIGSGASAAQVIPAIAPDVEELHVFQRAPHWVLPRHDYVFKPWQRRLLRLGPVYKALRQAIYWGLETRVLAFKYSRTLLRHFAQNVALRFMRRQIKDPDLRRQVTPDYAIGCKRILQSNTLYPTYQLPNVRLHTADDGIEEITEHGILTKTGNEVDVDLIVYATGYDATDGIISYPVVGRDGRSLAQLWNDYPRAYLGVTLPSFPNFFLIMGPNTGFGHTSVIIMIEAQMNYIMKSMTAVLERGSKSIEVTAKAEAEYTGLIHKEILKTVWAWGGCNSWYKSKSGRVVAMFPGFSFTFRRWANHFKQHHHQLG